jgi:hypothetical protein
MGQIRPPSDHGRIHARETTLDRFLDFVFSPAVRFGSAALAAATLVLFVVQAGTTLHSLSLLEGKFELRPESRGGPEVAYRVNTDAARKDPALQLLARHIVSEFGLQMNGSLLVAQRAVTQFTGGGSPGPIEMVQLASVLGSDPARLRSALRVLEQNATTVVLF